MKFVIVVAAFLVASFIGLHTILQNGSLRKYLDAHPDPDKVPPVEYYLGEGYYLFGDLENSATYYQRVAERYPASSYSDDAYFNYLQALDDMNTPRGAMADAYGTYLERFPKGSHTEVVLKRIEYCRNSR